MEFSCPGCQTSLAEQTPKPLPNKMQGHWLSRKRILSCPACQCSLRFNWHPIERVGQSILLGLLFIAVILDYLSGDVRWLLLIGGLALLGEFALQAWLTRQAPHWPRYQIHHDHAT